MSALGLPVIDKAAQDLNRWLTLLMDMLDHEDRQRAYRLLRSTLHAVRDRLGVNECAHFSAQLPVLVRGIYYEGWRPAQVPKPIRRADEFVALVEADFTKEPHDDPKDAVMSALAVIAAHVSDGEINDVKSTMSPALRTLWPD